MCILQARGVDTIPGCVFFTNERFVRFLSEPLVLLITVNDFDAAFMRVRPSWASGPAAAEMCALLISTKGIEDINVGTYPGGEVAVHVRSSRTSATART